MVPKKIHYCWFGGKPPSELMAKCLASWRTHLPAYEIKKWDETNSPMRFEYLEMAARNQKWSNMSNFVRLFSLFAEGGIYLDTDVEVVKPLDGLLGAPAFLGCEVKDPRVNTAVLGSERGHPFLLRTLSRLIANFNGTEYSNESGPNLATSVLFDCGLRDYSESPQLFGEVLVYPTRFFYPYYFGEKFHPDCITPETCTIHHWAKQW